MPSAHAGGLTPEQLADINRLTTTARFVTGLIHELNNSLQVVSGLVELLGDRTDIPGDAVVRLQRIGGQADKATAALRQVQAFTREAPDDRSTVDVSALIEDVLAVRRYQIGRAGITPVVESQQGSVRVTGDVRRLRQALLNLVLNAEEALAGHERRALRIGVGEAGGRVHVVVADSGAGVPEDLGERVFDPFVTTKAGPKCIGLGLTVARAIAEAHNGRLDLLPSAEGATFRLDLPAAG